MTTVTFIYSHCPKDGFAGGIDKTGLKIEN